jgi:hypothetical protein
MLARLTGVDVKIVSMNPLSILQNTEHNSTEKSAGVGRSVAHRSATKARYEQELNPGVIHSGSAGKPRLTNTKPTKPAHNAQHAPEIDRPTK